MSCIQLRELRDAVETCRKYLGCGDNSCLFVKPKGMATNGGCRCVDRGPGCKPFQKPALAKLFKAAAALCDVNPEDR